MANHYATLGLHRRCSLEQIRAAYRILAKAYHPDLNPGAAASVARTQELNEAYRVLSDDRLRQEYDAELAGGACEETATQPPVGTSAASRVKSAKLQEEMQLPLRDFFQGTTLAVRVSDPGNGSGPESYSLEIPPNTAPGARFQVLRDNGGILIVKLKMRSDYQFKLKGYDLKCDLKIATALAERGGTAPMRGPRGENLTVDIPRKIASGTEIRISGQGMPTPRGGRGDLWVQVTYRPEVQIRRGSFNRSS